MGKTEKKTFKFSDFAPDLEPIDTPGEAWNEANNVVFEDGDTVRTPGDSPTLPGSEARDIRAMVFATPNEIPYWLYATSDGVYAHDGTTEFDVTPAWWTGSELAIYTTCVLGGVPYINASDRDPLYWPGDPAVLCQPLPDWPTDGRCWALRSHKSFLFAVGMISDNGALVRWSDSADPGSVPQNWTPAADNLAGFQPLMPDDVDCLDAMALRDELYIYKSQSIWAARFVPDTDIVFAFREVFSERGVIAPNALARTINDNHFFLAGNGDICLTDGTQVRSVAQGKSQRSFYADLTLQRPALTAAASLARNSRCVIYYPSGVAIVPNRVVVFDADTQKITFRDCVPTMCAAEGQILNVVSDENTWDGDPEAWDLDLSRWNEGIQERSLDDICTGTIEGAMHAFNSSARQSGSVDLGSRAMKSGLAFGSSKARKLIKRLWPRVSGGDGDPMEIRVGGQESGNGPISWGPRQPYAVGQPLPVDLFQSGRFLAIEITAGTDTVYHWHSFDIEFEAAGKW